MERREDELFDVFAKEHQINWNIVYAYLNQAKRGSKEAEERIFQEFEYYIASVAVKYCFHDYERLADLVQIGYLALHQEIKSPKTNKRNIKTHTGRIIHAAIRNAFNNYNGRQDSFLTGRSKKCPGGICSSYLSLLNSYYEHYHGSPSDEFIMDTLDITYEQLTWLKAEFQVETIPFTKHFEKQSISSMEGIFETKDELERTEGITNFQYYIISELLKGKSESDVARSFKIERQAVNCQLSSLRKSLRNAEIIPEIPDKEIRILRKNGAIGIPKNIRNYFGINPGDNVILTLEDDKVIHKKEESQKGSTTSHRLKPLSLREIAISLYLRETLPSWDYRIYYDIYVSKTDYNDYRIMKKYHLTDIAFQQTLNKICKEIKAIPEEWIQEMIQKFLNRKQVSFSFNLDLSPKKKEKEKVSRMFLQK